ncbi:PREDICTED: transcription initiation factor TFIID subunit 4-like [Lipotes vexillifer]|uniref:Transcription initiation factor TFIID subunit 4-like n=1 Tax=Lipotes vexillifer TaxID=118797 RepID=A0A340XTY8_LIPVE|nr:PREDICTED: transcription initiation factor TFIID subunit 4-like [Lipotes vexillifer]
MPRAANLIGICRNHKSEFADPRILFSRVNNLYTKTKTSHHHETVLPYSPSRQSYLANLALNILRSGSRDPSSRTPGPADALRGPGSRTHASARPRARPPTAGPGPAPSPAPAPASSGPRAPFSGPPPGAPPRGRCSRARTPARAAARSWGSRASLPVSPNSARRAFPRAGSRGGRGEGRGPEKGHAGRQRRTKKPAGGRGSRKAGGRAQDARPEQQSGRGRASLPLGRAGGSGEAVAARDLRELECGRRRRGQLRPAAGEGARRGFF